MTETYYVCAYNVTLVAGSPEGLIIRGVEERYIIEVQARDAGHASQLAREIVNKKINERNRKAGA